MTTDHERLTSLAVRVCAAIESRTGGSCTWHYGGETVAVLSFRLEAEGKVVGAACSGVALRDIIDPAIIEQHMVRILLEKLAVTRETTR
jgi:hypothetical protein